MIELIKVELKKAVRLKTIIVALLLIGIYCLLCFKSYNDEKGRLLYAENQLKSQINTLELDIERYKSVKEELKEKGQLEECESYSAKEIKAQEALCKTQEELQCLRDNNKRLEKDINLIEQSIKGKYNEDADKLIEERYGKTEIEKRSLFIKEYERLSYYKDSGLVPQDNNLNVVNILKIFSKEISPLFMALIIIMLMGDIISGEESEGTLRGYLCLPITRWKIFISKYVSSLIICAVVIIGIQLMFFVGTGIASGWGSLKLPLEYNAQFLNRGDIISYTPASQAFIYGWQYILCYFLTQLLYIGVVVAIGMCASSYFNSPVLSISAGCGLLLFLYYGFIELNGLDKLRSFIFMSYGDIWRVLSGDIKIWDTGLGILKAELVLIATQIIFFIASSMKFKSKEVYS